MVLRLGLACVAQQQAGAFRFLLEIDPAGLHDRSPAGVREYLLQLSWPWRRNRSWQSRNWTFADPLRSDRVVDYRCHYAEGERRLLTFLGGYLRRSPVRGSAAGQALEQDLLEYVRIRNAFHQLLVHNNGGDGLMRFVETFGRRGSLLFGRGHQGRRRSPFRRRRRQMVLGMERTRMTAALNSQLLSPFDTTSHQHAPPRRIEMRGSVPSGNYLWKLVVMGLLAKSKHAAGHHDLPPLAYRIAYPQRFPAQTESAFSDKADP